MTFKDIKKLALEEFDFKLNRNTWINWCMRHGIEPIDKRGSHHIYNEHEARDILNKKIARGKNGRKNI